MEKHSPDKQLRDDTARIVADIHGVSVRYVQMIRDGDRENDEIMATLVEYRLGKSKLIKHLEKLIPLTSNPSKHGRKKN